MKKEFYKDAITLYALRAIESIDVLTGFSVEAVRSTKDDAIGKISGVTHVCGYDPEVKWFEFREIEDYAEKQKKLVRYACEEKLS